MTADTRQQIIAGFVITTVLAIGIVSCSVVSGADWPRVLVRWPTKITAVGVQRADAGSEARRTADTEAPSQITAHMAARAAQIAQRPAVYGTDAGLNIFLPPDMGGVPPTTDGAGALPSTGAVGLCPGGT